MSHFGCLLTWNDLVTHTQVGKDNIAGEEVLRLLQWKWPGFFFCVVVVFHHLAVKYFNHCSDFYMNPGWAMLCFSTGSTSCISCFANDLGSFFCFDGHLHAKASLTLKLKPVQRPMGETKCNIQAKTPLTKWKHTLKKLLLATDPWPRLFLWDIRKNIVQHCRSNKTFLSQSQKNEGRFQIPT